VQKRARLNQTNTVQNRWKTARGRPSSLYSVQLYLVWFTKNYIKLYENALSYPCGSTDTKNANAKSRICTSTQFPFSFPLFYSLSLAFSPYFSLMCAIPLSLSLPFSLYFSLSLSHTHAHKHTYVAFIYSYRLFQRTHTHTHTHIRFFFLSSQFDWMHLCVLMQNKAYYTLTYLSKDVT